MVTDTMHSVQNYRPKGRETTNVLSEVGTTSYLFIYFIRTTNHHNMMLS